MSETVTDYKGHRRTLFFLPGNISLFIMCVGIIWNNPLLDRRARTEILNLDHWARHALLHMAPECFDHSATRAGPIVEVE